MNKRFVSPLLIFGLILIFGQPAFAVKSKLDSLFNMTVKGMQVSDNSSQGQYELGLDLKSKQESNSTNPFKWFLDSVDTAEDQNQTVPKIDESLTIQIPCIEYNNTNLKLDLSFVSNNKDPDFVWEFNDITEVAFSNKNRNEDPKVENSTQLTLKESMNNFSFDLFQEVINYQRYTEGDSDFFFAPYGIYQSLAKAYAGARNNTAAEFKEVLYLEQDQGELHNSLNKLNLDLERRGKGYDDILESFPWVGSSKIYGFKMDMANSVWISKGNPFLELTKGGINKDYLDLLAENYGEGIRFLSNTDPSAMASKINKWASRTTEREITQAVSPEDLSASSRMLLSNIVYFEAIWEDKFDPEDTNSELFTPLSGSQYNRDMMYQRNNFNFYAGDNYKAIELPYDHRESLKDLKDMRVSMLIVLPETGGFEEVQENLNAQELEQIISGFEQKTVDLKLPTWDGESSFNLTGVLKQLGLEDAFKEKSADFSGMLSPGIVQQIKDQLYLSKFTHKAKVKVDEHGTKASAFSGEIGNEVDAPAMSDVKNFYADRSFIYLIWDKPTDTIIFMGRVVE